MVFPLSYPFFSEQKLTTVHLGYVGTRRIRVQVERREDRLLRGFFLKKKHRP